MIEQELASRRRASEPECDLYSSQRAHTGKR